MSSIYRTWTLPAIVLVILLAAAPGAIHQLMLTGDPYLFTRRFFEDMAARLSGPGRLRFIIQPLAAVLLGARDGMRDARAGALPFLWGVVFHREHRPHLLRSSLASISNLVAIAVLLDIISQYLIFRQIHPGAALLLGPVLISVPYAITRASANRIAGHH